MEGGEGWSFKRNINGHRLKKHLLQLKTTPFRYVGGFRKLFQFSLLLTYEICDTAAVLARPPKYIPGAKWLHVGQIKVIQCNLVNLQQHKSTALLLVLWGALSGRLISTWQQAQSFC